jgi:2-oxo-4-hydroxy-4-carboxy-5-ureidoimidazoline decarboxylase
MEPWLRLDRVEIDEARALLRTCCGSSAWVEGMLLRRPYRTREGLLAAARQVWFGLDRSHWLEAFSHHPKIGDRDALRGRFAATRHLSEKEQAGVAAAREETLDALARANEEYDAKFGYIFIVCATGRSAEEMLAMLQERLQNEPEAEIQIAAEEQAKISELRLMNL